MTVVPVVRSLPELVANVHRLPLINRIFDVRSIPASAVLTPDLALKYGTKATQHVVSIRNRFDESAVFFNPERNLKPQFFREAQNKQAQAKTPGGCDFCEFQRLTATDTFGRIEGEHVATASNLFKYVGPYQVRSIWTSPAAPRRSLALYRRSSRRSRS